MKQCNQIEKLKKKKNKKKKTEQKTKTERKGHLNQLNGRVMHHTRGIFSQLR